MSTNRLMEVKKPMALGTKAKRAIIWTTSALAGAGLLVGSFFAGAAVAENDELEQASAPSQQEDTRDHNGDRDRWELFERDGQDEDAEDRDADGQDSENQDGQDQDGQDREGQDQDADGQDAEDRPAPDMDRGGPDRDDRGHGDHRDGRHGGHEDGDAEDGTYADSGEGSDSA